VHRWFSGGSPDAAALRYVVVTLPAETARRLAHAPFTRYRIHLARRQLIATGSATVRVFVADDLATPLYIYEMSTAAARYAETRLHGDSRLPVALRRFLRWIMGCDPSAGAIVVVGVGP
jgi:hypothetical protein